ncbi:MAG TPA: MarR family transcriptional regulator [Ilumatobacteraceae bacterium]|jgi:DNA-binding MarR family transcriptional regulator|nr:MarR family transcriptional regulator [Ilumatobacteraceae bacterium]
MPTLQKISRRESASFDLANTLRPTVTRLARRLRQQDRTGLGPTITAALSSIYKHGGLTHGELAAIEQVAPPTITSIVGKMEALGLVTRETDTNDRRVTRIRITPAGVDQLDEVRNRRTSWLASQLSSLTDDERARLSAAADVLAKIVDNVEGSA